VPNFFPERTIVLLDLSIQLIAFVLLCSVITEQDADRVWSSVENAIKVMAEEEAQDN
jgi:hypothetical protein